MGQVPAWVCCSSYGKAGALASVRKRVGANSFAPAGVFFRLGWAKKP